MCVSIVRKLDALLLTFIHRLSEHQPLWLYAVPLIHFLYEDSKPFKPVNKKEPHNVSNTNWWGAEKFEVAKNQLKSLRDL